MTIRPYDASDFDAVWELHNAALEGTGAHPGNGPWDEDLKEIPNVYQDSRGCFFVGSLGTRIVAMGAIKCTDPTRAEIKRMRVHPDLQRRGCGTEMLRALEAEARRLGYEVLHLDTTTLQTAAQKLYEKQGYRKVGTSSAGKFTTLLYEKRLTDSN